MKELLRILDHLVTPRMNGGGVLATLVAVEGSSYRRPGARLLVTASGERIGSISGGCLEEDVLARAQAVAQHGRAELVVYDTTSENDLVWGVGLGCHGVVHVLLEKVESRAPWAVEVAHNLGAHRSTSLAVLWRRDPAGGVHATGTYLQGHLPCPATTGAAIFRQEILPPTPLVIFGAGDDAQPLSRIAKELGWHVTVADPRPAFVTASRFPSADRLVPGRADELVGQVAPGARALVVVMTHHYVHDLPIIRDLLSRPLAYLGLLGPKKRADKILSDLHADAVEARLPGWQRRLHAPVGLDLGADAPEEVALAIVAEMQAVLAGRDARPLRERVGPIHS